MVRCRVARYVSSGSSTIHKGTDGKSISGKDREIGGQTKDIYDKGICVEESMVSECIMANKRMDRFKQFIVCEYMMKQKIGCDENKEKDMIKNEMIKKVV
eukprot:517263_1